MNATIAKIQRLDRGIRKLGGPTPDDARRRFARATAGAGHPETFEGFVHRANPSLLGYEHVPRLVDVAQRVVDGELRRVLVLMPPRYFKSEVFSRLLPAYYLSRFPTRHVGLASYSADLAWKLSGKARENYRQMGGLTADDTDAKKLWATAAGGEMWAAGIDGSITGSGFHLGIIDDPMKPKHARSRAYVEAFQAFYPDTWYNRQEPGAAMIVVMQRLGLHDPIDFLYRREVGDEQDEAPEHWHVVVCDEVKSDEPLGRYDGPRGLPSTCTVEPDERSAGEVLAPSRFSADEVQRQQRAAGLYAAPQRQQRPGTPTGDFWREGWFVPFGTLGGNPLDELPPGAHSGGKDWDTAYTKNEANSASAYVESFRDDARDATGRRQPNVYFTACDWRWLETPELVAWMKRIGGPHHIEAKASGKSAKQFLDREGVPASEVQVVAGDKWSRSADVQPIVGTIENEQPVATGRVFVHVSIWEKLLRGDRQGLLHVTAEQLVEGAAGLDLNDAFVQALHRHSAPTAEWSSAASVGGFNRSNR